MAFSVMVTIVKLAHMIIPCIQLHSFVTTVSKYHCFKRLLSYWDMCMGQFSWLCYSCSEAVLCENSDGWLVAWGQCECMLLLSSAVWLLPFTLL